MGRLTELRSARLELSKVIGWAERQGFANIVAALRRVLAALAEK